jgi:hypothetical protein
MDRRTVAPKGSKLRVVGKMVCATIRMQKMAANWKLNTKLRDKLLAQSKKQRKLSKEADVSILV